MRLKLQPRVYVGKDVSYNTADWNKKSTSRVGQKRIKYGHMKILFIIGIIVITGISYLVYTQVGETEIFLLPKGYQGAVYIIYNQKNGQLVKYDNGSRLYEVPPEGIIRSQFGPNDGWSSFLKCYYVESDGKRRSEIPFETENKNRKNDTLQACCLSAGTSFKNGGKPVVYSMFYIGTKQAIDSASIKEEKREISKYAE